LNRTVARYIARIFEGAAPSDLPIEQPTHFDFAVNLKIANKLGLTIPPAIVARADEVIE
jgi:putative ABC transport system substrate-binding protein